MDNRGLNIVRSRLPQPITDYLQKQEASSKWHLSEFVRTVIVSTLLEDQYHICMYCESRLSPTNQHIEHIVERHDDATKTYDFNNMGLSCMGGMHKTIPDETALEQLVRVPNMHCGHYKTLNFHKNVELNYAVFIDPFAEALYEYFEFEDAIIVPLKGLSDEMRAKAAYTIERLNLNSSRLVYARRLHLDAFRKKLSTYKSMSAAKKFATSILNLQNGKKIPFWSFIERHSNYFKYN